MLIRGKYQTVVIEIVVPPDRQVGAEQVMVADDDLRVKSRFTGLYPETLLLVGAVAPDTGLRLRDRKSTRLNSSHVRISYAVFCLKKKRLMPDGTPLLSVAPGTVVHAGAGQTFACPELGGAVVPGQEVDIQHVIDTPTEAEVRFLS